MARTPDAPLRGWIIWCDWTQRPYVPRGWSTEAEARRELAVLLRGYPETSIWRTALVVREAGKR